MYTGVIVQNSLKNPSILDGFQILKKWTDEDWELYKVDATKEQIQSLSGELSDGHWYTHFWQDNELIVVFKDKIFEFDVNDKDGRLAAVEYGMSIGIPEEQLDFRTG